MTARVGMVWACVEQGWWRHWSEEVEYRQAGEKDLREDSWMRACRGSTVATPEEEEKEAVAIASISGRPPVQVF